MKRSVRNGLAIAGMAGGMWLLGQAVANADEVATPSADTSVTQDDSGGGGNTNLSSNNASAENVQVTNVETDVDGGDGGSNSASVNTGIVSGSPLLESTARSSGHHDDGTSVTINTGDVSVTQQANGGDVNNSGNVAVAGGGDQTATATANTTVDQTSTGGDDHHGRDHHGDDKSFGGHNGHDDGGNVNVSENNANASNEDITNVETDVNGGDGGSNYADINTGIIGNFYCDKGGCTYNITTGDVTVWQQANGGNVNNSGNVGVGAPVPGAQCQCAKPAAPVCPEEKAAPAVKPAAAPAAPRHAAPVLSSAQPSGQLAFTGAETSLPLTLGLLALGAGGALTLAGRRRETATV